MQNKCLYNVLVAVVPEHLLKYSNKFLKIYTERERERNQISLNSVFL